MPLARPLDTPISSPTRAAAALWGLFAGDAIAMPVHWYYDLSQLRADFGRIRTYEAPKPHFPNSIMSLSSTGGGGRGSDAGDIVGRVILHGKRKYWKRGGQFHYHHGMQAGENTLEAQLARVALRTFGSGAGSLRTFASETGSVRTLTSERGELRTLTSDTGELRTFAPAGAGGGFSVAAFRDAYVKFMTTPGSHNDTYASTCHRMFFANFDRGLPLQECPDNDHHNVDTIDGLTVPAAVAVAGAARGLPPEQIVANAKAAAAATRRSVPLQRHVEMYVRLLLRLFDGVDLRIAVKDAAAEIKFDVAASAQGSDPMTACYLHNSYPAMLHFAYKYAHSPEAALLASANAGGENVARGSALGALLGAAHGQLAPAWLQTGLLAHAELRDEIERAVGWGPPIDSAAAKSAAKIPPAAEL